MFSFKMCVGFSSKADHITDQSSLHYGLRAMGAMLLWISVLCLHIQMFQMEISTLSIILFAAKYSRQVKRGPVELGADLAERKMNVALDQTIILGL